MHAANADLLLASPRQTDKIDLLAVKQVNRTFPLLSFSRAQRGEGTEGG